MQYTFQTEMIIIIILISLLPAIEQLKYLHIISADCITRSSDQKVFRDC